MPIDNASSQGRAENLSGLVLVDGLFLPKNTASVLKSLYAVVIACVKRRHRRNLEELALSLIENEIPEIYTV